MPRIRVIPILLLQNAGLVKTIRFKNPTYIGDPINAVKIFNEKEVDELALIDIGCTLQNREPNYSHIEEIVSEAFMPLAYGGGITTLDAAKKVFDCGVEKIIINASASQNPRLISQVANVFGSQSMAVSVDVKRNIFGKYIIYTHGGKKKVKMQLVEFLKQLETFGAGEVILTNINREGTFEGYDVHLYELCAHHVNIPIVANGGAHATSDFLKAIQSGASAVAAGSFFIYKGKERGILINYPTQEELTEQIFKYL